MNYATVIAFTTAAATHVGGLLLAGLCLGIGFYLAKKFTNWIDVKLAMNNPAIQQILNNPYLV